MCITRYRIIYLFQSYVVHQIYVVSFESVAPFEVAEGLVALFGVGGGFLTLVLDLRLLLLADTACL